MNRPRRYRIEGEETRGGVLLQATFSQGWASYLRNDGFLNPVLRSDRDNWTGVPIDDISASFHST